MPSKTAPAVSTPRPAYLPKQRFLMLMRNERLAALRTDYDEANHTLSIHGKAARPRAATCAEDGRLAIEAFFRRFMPKELHGPPKVLFGEAHSFSDVAKKVVSIINLASVAAVENVAGAAVIPCAFAAISMLPAGRPGTSSICSGRDRHRRARAAKVVKRIQRCAATEVDPETGIRDLAIPRILMDNFGHADCGIYAEVIAGGDDCDRRSRSDEKRPVE